MVHAPGSILQHMYLRERLMKLPPGHFLEIGAGRGAVSNILLNLGWTGVGYDLNPEALAEAKKLNNHFVQSGKLQLICADWLSANSSERFDLIISCFVLEHLNDEMEQKYFERCEASLNTAGTVALMVPSSPKHWNLEDEIAGHYRRYTQSELIAKMAANNLQCEHLVGLNYPLTNMLQPLAQVILKMNHLKEKVASKSVQQRTISSGNWKIPMLTTFPSLFSLILNERMMLPFYWLQNYNHQNPQCLVLYSESKRSTTQPLNV